MSTSPDNPCSKGHTSGRRKNGNCIQCEKERYKNNPTRAEYTKRKQAERRAAIKADPKRAAEQRAYMARYAKDNRTKLTAQSRELYKKHKIKIRLRRKGIIPSDEIVFHIENHNGLCDLCGGPPRDRWEEFAYDHCHTTGVFRGLLCGTCNRGLGYFKDNPKLLRRAANYVEHYK